MNNHRGGFPLHPTGRRTLGPRRDSGTGEIAAWAELDHADASEEVRALGARLLRGDLLLESGLIEARAQPAVGPGLSTRRPKEHPAT